MVRNSDGKVLFAYGKFLGNQTNTFAESTAAVSFLDFNTASNSACVRFGLNWIRLLRLSCCKIVIKSIGRFYIFNIQLVC